MILGWYHPDWALDSESSDEVLRDFARVDSDSASTVLAEIDGLLASGATESQLDDLLTPPQSPDPREGRGWVEWLEHARDVLSGPTE
jgi:hypothetical protein